MAVTEVLQVMSELERNLEPVFTGLKDTTLGESGRHVFHAAKFFIMSEKKHQKAERIRALGLGPELARQYVRDSDRHNDQGLGRLRAAMRALEQGKAAMKKPQMDQFEEVTRSGEFRDELRRARDAIQGHFVKADLLPEQAGETYAICNEAFDALEKEGPDGLTRFCEKNLRELASRRESADRGRSPRSPILWWKAVLLAFVWGVQVWDVIHCYIWRGCSDVFRHTWDTIKLTVAILAAC